MVLPEEVMKRLDRVVNVGEALASRADSLTAEVQRVDEKTDAVDRRRSRDLRVYIILAVIVLIFGVWNAVLQIQSAQRGHDSRQILRNVEKLVTRQTDCSASTGSCFQHTLSELEILMQCSKSTDSIPTMDACVKSAIAALPTPSGTPNSGG